LPKLITLKNHQVTLHLAILEKEVAHNLSTYFIFPVVDFMKEQEHLSPSGNFFRADGLGFAFQ
jgi:hypothetical protein